MKYVFALALAMLPVTSWAQYHYDYQTGNSYNTYSTGYSTTTVGYNNTTGSSWTQTQKRDGSYYGTDSKGNYFYGNQNTGYYQNSGTGRTCYGKGSSRVCY